MRQQENRVARAWRPDSGPAFDAIRIEQFLDLQRDLLLASGDPETLPERLVHGVGAFLGVAGTAVGVVEDGRYRLLATYGVGPEYHGRWDGLSLRDPDLAGALGHTRPVIHDDAGALTTVILPFRLADATGALHLVVADGRGVAGVDLELGRALAGLAGIALANARQCRRLARVARSKGDALTAMAHDLRAPLNALVGYTSLLGEGAFGPLSGEQRDVAATLERQAIELVDLLGATLDVARLETGQLPLRVEEFPLADVLGALAQGTFAQAVRQDQLAIALAPDLPRLRTDRVKVKEIVQNLVGNALKHSAGGPVEVEAVLAPDRETIRITVRDSGPGIAADVLPHLFEPARPGPGPHAGTGFGLYIVRCFSEALGGRVAARSAAGEGTAVTVELPLRAPER
ncbi:MAG TPA: HAMP domain-containing sensor histidine kinase [Candidatus Binatia bacterium]|nr:HAMP domain-containing sensor histidine kinase [Candidatus Binatia bacterium]